MRIFKSRTLLCATALAIGLMGCDGAPTGTGVEDSAPVALNFQINAAENDMISLIAIEVTGPGIPVPIVSNFEMIDGTASGTLKVPPGQDRIFTGRGFDTQGSITHEGSVLENVRPGMATVRIPLRPRGVGVPVDATLSTYIISIDPPAAEMNIGEVRQFTASVTDAVGEPVETDPASLIWGSSNPAIARVNALGSVIAGGIPGTTRVVVSYEGIAAEANLTITENGTIPEDDLLSVTVTSSLSEVEPGQRFDIVTTVRNRGAEAVTNVQWWLILDDARAEAAPGAYGIVPAGDGNNGIGILYALPEALEPGQEIAWTATVYSRQVQGATIVARAWLQSYDGPEDPYLDNNEASTEIQVTEGRIVFVSDRNGSLDLFTVRPDGTDLRQLTETAAAESDPAWAPDRSRIAFIRDGSLWVINSDGSGETRLDVPADNRPTWSPDESRIAVSGRPVGSEYLQILIYDLEAGSYTNLTASMDEQWLSKDWRHLDWSPDGDELIGVESTAAEWEQWGGGYLTIIGLDGTVSTIAYYAVTGGACFNSAPQFRYPRWSPDKRSIAVDGGDVLRNEPDEEFGVYCSGGWTHRTSLNPGGLTLSWPSWSANGEYLVFGSRPADSEEGTFDLVTIRSDGTGPMPNITNWPSNDIHPQW